MLILNKYHPANNDLEGRTEVITPEQAEKADIRALRLGILNLMPVMDQTENDILQNLGHSILQIEPVWLIPGTRKKNGKNTPVSHISSFYQTLEQATQHKNLDGLIVTGSPIESLPFEKVDYWEEFNQIANYAQKNIFSSMFLCWSAIAAANVYYGARKTNYSEKLVGVFNMKNSQGDLNPLTKGMNPWVRICQSRNAGVNQQDLANLERQGLIVKLFESEDSSIRISAFASRDSTSVFNLGHFEYSSESIRKEVERDQEKGLTYPVEGYYGYSGEVLPISWKSDSTLFYTNFVNNIYHQMNKVPKSHRPFNPKF